MNLFQKLNKLFLEITSLKLALVNKSLRKVGLFMTYLILLLIAFSMRSEIEILPILNLKKIALFQMNYFCF